jgi:S-formylglutathione hydrolase
MSPLPMAFPTAFAGTDVVVRAEHACFGGVQGFYEHHSVAIGGPMRFGLFRPAAIHHGQRVPVLVCLAGLTCSDDTFAIKAGAQRLADTLGMALLTPDTSPRHARFDGDDASWDFGVGAGFYLDATVAPWSGAYRMEAWLLDELVPLMATAHGIDGARVGITGHSMGGHGALTLSLRHPARFTSVSALAPICAPRLVPWGKKAFLNYLGSHEQHWRAHDACALLEDGARFPGTPLVDQGLADKFMVEQLLPEELERTTTKVSQPLTLRRHPGFDHGYFFIQSVVNDHLRHHADAFGLDLPR